MTISLSTCLQLSAAPQPRSATLLTGLTGLTGIVLMSLALSACGPAADSAAPASSSEADNVRLANLQELAAVIGNWYALNRDLPSTLIALGPSAGMSSALVKAVENHEYDYEVLGNEDYNLCARFDMQSKNLNRDNQWYHDAGKHCFRLSPAYGQY
ncbi:MAG TPA: hypothetical protein GX696_04200 [Pseudomonadaceae bacterium]|nr:hypothetical protein [Pseudomonadaceae bacterium]